jgi:hypothetical protein
MMSNLAWQTLWNAKTAHMATTLPAELPLRLIERLRAEGVATLEEWAALGRRRRQIFGVTKAAVEQLDTLAKETSRPKR